MESASPTNARKFAELFRIYSFEDAGKKIHVFFFKKLAWQVEPTAFQEKIKFSKPYFTALLTFL